ncbi:MAG TPA: CocE/NonD family hydrolase [Thermomicrobiales bacterium]|nr:CocE/NonD family hydrolase [Thermomicrobiales bacterium]
MTETTERTAPRLLLDQRVTMRDGVELSADVYLPPTGDGPWPAILQRTPYDNTGALWVNIAIHFAQHGYAFVSQDVRGRCDSDGEWEPFVNEGPDGHDTIEWIAEQDWCDSKVGMMGGSYGGYVQWMAAREQPPHLTALVSTAAAGRWMQELPYINGTFAAYWMFWLNLVGGRTLQQPIHGSVASPDWPRIFTHKPLRETDIALGRTNTVWRTWLEHNTFDDYWRQLSLTGHFDKIDLPVLHITGWFDGDQWGELFYWHGMLDDSPAADRQWLVSGPWDHAGTRTPKQHLGGRDFTTAALTDMNAIHLRFFDRWLKGIENGQESDARVRTFAMGDNEWREGDSWPPAGTVETPFYLHSGGAANTLAGNGTISRTAPNGDEPADSYVYNPDNPTPSVQDISALPFGDVPFDNRWKLRRDDVLVYTSEPLVADLEITGHPFVVLHAESDCPDTDWYVALCDVHPDGRSERLTSGGLRAAYREGLDAQPTAIEPGRVYEYRIELMATSNVWKAGHRLRVTVASANWPGSARNPNTNAPTGDDDEIRIATNTVHHTRAYPSRLLAPVVAKG